MGLFGAFGRALAGKQPYGPEDSVGQTGKPAPQHNEDGAPVRKDIPEVRIKRVESRISGQRLDVYADIHNESHEAIFLDRAFALQIKRELDAQLLPGQSKQFVIYSGPLLVRQPSGYVELQYRKQSDGDYFANYHQIRSRQVGHEGYEITECIPAGPVKDI